MPAVSDTVLLTILDQALANAGQRAGGWLACRPGCNACCHGVFAISSLDAKRLTDGLSTLRTTDPARAARITERVAESRCRLTAEFPGDPTTGRLSRNDEDFEERFADFANEERCPVLDPATGTCDLYDSRPVTCRVFGPPVRSEEGLGVCELCFQGAPESEIARCEMHLPPPELEEKLTHELGDWQTIVAFAFGDQLPPAAATASGR